MGVITKPYGIKGQVRIRSYTCSPDFFLTHKKLLTSSGNELRLGRLKISSGGEVIACVGGVYNRTDAERLRLCEIYVERSELPQLAIDEYYYEDLVGMNVLDTSQQILGKVIAIYDYGAGEFLEIKMGKQTAMIMFNNNAIVSIDDFIIINKNFLLI